MSYSLKPFPNQERLLIELFRSRLELVTPAERARVGRDEIGDLATPEGVSLPWYIRVLKLPAGSADRFEGDFVLDVEVFAPEYLLADSIAQGLDALLLGYPHSVELDGEVVVIDSVGQNVAPGEIPWDDPAVSRIFATYVITLRR